MTPDEAVELVSGLADEEDTLMDEERQAIGVLLAERERLLALVRDGYELSRYSACTREDQNTPEYMEGLVEKIESFQPKAEAALAGKAQP